MTEAALQERPITSRQIKVGDVPIGGGTQIAVQSMTNTMTYDVEATVQQVYDLNAAGAARVRINPGNIGGDDRFRTVIEKCQESGCAMRIGVNSGSVEKRFRDLPKAEALVASALHKVEIAEEMGFFNFKVSLKASHVPEMVEANKAFRKHSDAPLHLGVTEAGTKMPGAIKSAAALGQL